MMTKIMKTASGTLLYFNEDNKKFQSSNMEEILNTLNKESESEDIVVMQMATGILGNISYFGVEEGDQELLKALEMFENDPRIVKLDKELEENVQPCGLPINRALRDLLVDKQEKIWTEIIRSINPNKEFWGVPRMSFYI